MVLLVLVSELNSKYQGVGGTISRLSSVEQMTPSPLSD